MANDDDIVPHDGVAEWADCMVCGTHLDPVGAADAPADWDGGCWRCGATPEKVGLRPPMSRARTGKVKGGRVEIRLPEDLDRDLSAICKRLAISRAAALRLALRLWMDQYSK